MKHPSMLETHLLLIYILSYQSTKNFFDLFVQFFKNWLIQQQSKL